MFCQTSNIRLLDHVFCQTSNIRLLDHMFCQTSNIRLLDHVFCQASNIRLLDHVFCQTSNIRLLDHVFCQTSNIRLLDHVLCQTTRSKGVLKNRHFSCKSFVICYCIFSASSVECKLYQQVMHATIVTVAFENPGTPGSFLIICSLYPYFLIKNCIQLFVLNLSGTHCM